MSKLKAVIVVVLLVGGGGAGALFGLNQFYQARVEGQVQALLGDSEQRALDKLRVQAFEDVQRLSRIAPDDKLRTALDKLPAAGTNGNDEAVRKAYQPAHDELLPVVEALQKKSKVKNLAVISPEGRVAAQVPAKEKFGESLKGLPAFTDCLQGISRDGTYEMGGKPQRISVVPIRDDRGRTAGCLMSAAEIGAMDAKTLAGATGLHAAFFLRAQVAASTLDEALLAPLSSQLASPDIVWFGEPEGGVPLLTKFAGKGYAARTIAVPGGTAGLHVAMVLSMGDLLQPLKEAQNMLFMGVGALFIVGLLLGLLLSGRRPNAEAQRLRDAVSMLVSGDATSLNVEGYSGVFQDLAQSISHLTGGGARPSPAYHAESVSDLLGKPEEPVLADAIAAPAAPEGSSLDFESLLGGASEPPRAAEPPPLAPERPPVVPAVPPAMPGAELSFGDEEPQPVRRPSPPPPPPPPRQPASGPRVELPGELAGIFDETEETREVEPLIPPQAVPERPRREAMPPPPGSERLAFVPPAVPPAPLDSMDLPPAAADDEQITSSDYRPDATVIAQVPDELLKAAASSGFESGEAMADARMELPEPPRLRPLESAPKQPAGDNAHFKDVFDQFVSTKKQCGESTAGLTFDRFAEKLRKNTGDLKARYKCRTVKFQVYVKNGKAALKATPIK